MLQGMPGISLFNLLNVDPCFGNKIPIRDSQYVNIPKKQDGFFSSFFEATTKCFWELPGTQAQVYIRMQLPTNKK